METIMKILEFLNFKCERPEVFGSFHLIGVACVVVATVLLVWLLKNASGKGLRVLMLFIWLILVLGELVREGLTIYGTALVEMTDFTYQWYMFPYQLCSSPLYLLPLVVILPDGRVRNAIMTFLGTFSLIGGLSVVIYPPEVLCGTTIINYQAFAHHGFQVFIGILCMVRLRERGLGFTRYLSSVAVFAVMTGIAMILNVVIHNHIVESGIDDMINLFYISPYYNCAIPILSDIQRIVPYPVFVGIYILGFSVAALLVFYIQKLIISLCTRNTPKKIRRRNAKIRDMAGL